MAPEPAERPADISNQASHFLALDKCLPGRHFLQLMNIPSEADMDTMRPLKLEYDREWLAITRAFALEEPLSLGDPHATVPRAKSQQEYADLIDEQRVWVDKHISDGDMIVPQDFEVTAPVYDGGNWLLPQYSQVVEYTDSLTLRFCKMLQIPNPFDISEEERQQRIAEGPRPDPEAEIFSSGRGRGGSNHSYGRARGRSRGRGGGRGRFRGR